MICTVVMMCPARDALTDSAADKGAAYLSEVIRREPTCAGFFRNAQEIFSGSPITVFSTPKPNLGMWG